MKKIITLMLAAVILLTLTACGRETTAPENGSADRQEIVSQGTVSQEPTPGEGELGAIALARANELMDQHFSMFSERTKGAVELIDMSVDGDYGDCLFNVSEDIGEGGLLTIHWRFHITYRLQEDGWSTGAWNGKMSLFAYDWKLTGEWHGQAEGKEFWLKIHSCDPDAMTVEAEYNFGGNEVSDGIETLYIVNQDYWDDEQREWSLSHDEDAHHGFVDIYPYGASYSDAGEGSGILADDGDTHCWLERA